MVPSSSTRVVVSISGWLTTLMVTMSEVVRTRPPAASAGNAPTATSAKAPRQPLQSRTFRIVSRSNFGASVGVIVDVQHDHALRGDKTGLHRSGNLVTEI